MGLVTGTADVSPEEFARIPAVACARNSHEFRNRHLERAAQEHTEDLSRSRSPIPGSTRFENENGVA